ncbi:D-alanyl-D-alanine carboxypeptidase [Streptomyces sp. NPDC049627]|uniref:D-alanyl-D-alanine carboxypeptidase n=1 Tax=Streptomyces sp. NPDC049627 TaxID=3365595 RepID=UPI00378D42AA
MAGESPDKSKQRESSAEPTSGSAGPVPASRPESAVPARDPRLAMARESAAPQGRSVSLQGRPTAPQSDVDTATRVLSRHDLEAVRAELAKAAAEAGADGAEAVGQGAGSGKAGGADAVGRGSENGKADDADTGDEGAENGDATPEDAAAPTADSEAPGAEAEADGAEGTRRSDAGAVDSEALPGRLAAEAGDAGDGEAVRVEDAKPGHAEAEAGSAGDAEAAQAESAEGAADGADSEASGKSDDDAEAPGDDRLRAAVAAWVASSGTADEDAETDSGTEEGKGADAAPKAEAGPDTEASGEAAGEGSGASPEAAAAEAADAGEAAPAADDTPAATEPATEPATESDPAPDDAPAAADGEDAPQGPPVPGDESRTGGAGGNTKAEGEAKAVDQPTAVFKAVRPKPHVDQPTTMLKAPKPEAPSERTSKFVALKPDIKQDSPKAPAPAPAPDVTAAIPQVGPERTTQQPLPPKPPLDLLAELTNTPPPPDTPVRTLVRRIKIWTPLVLLLAIIFAIAQAVRPLPAPTLALTAEESYAFDGSKASLPWPGEGQGWMDVTGIGTMGNFGEQTPVAIGSVAKAMTAYLVLKDHPLQPGKDGEKIKIDALAEKEGGYNKDGESTLDTVKEGDEITLHDAIAAIMIPSANNIARLLARWDAGTEKAFIEKMNATAEELGMKNTTYTDASGLKESTVSTAEDQVKLGNELVKIPALMEITSMGQWIDPSGKKWYNYNYLVPYNGAIGIKTGTTTAAGGNLLFAARKEVGGETVTLVGAVLGQHKSPIIQTVNDVSKTAMLAAQDELTSAKILKKGDVVGYVDDGLGGHTPVVLTEDVTAVGWPGFRVKLSFDADDVPHTAKAGTKVGTLTVGDGTSGAVKVPVALETDLTEPGFTQKLTRLL